MAQKIREEFRSGNSLVVHWDGKLVMDLTTKEHVDRLPIIISGLEAPNCSPSPSWAVARERAWGAAVVSALETWGVADQVVGMPFDTTASNTGPQKRGLCPHEQKNGERPAAFLPVVTISWRVVVHAVFVRVLWVSPSPEHLSFSKRFQTSWGEHRPRGLRTGNLGEEVATVLEDVKDEGLRWTL
ncbi:hypothetical protein GWK47_039686 [Chionoecetes opilio]|uniref:Uncharacterized protein n=1 Tax=Chionoecetes opilio TaxID=41210 RepID=A0A8J5CXN7_CHIOP|nr:hypothetical protein GWK47_039686 [Chionoecetes opilio]